MQNIKSSLTDSWLGIDGTPINEVPKGIGGLKFLNDLEGFPIGGGEYLTLRWCKSCVCLPTIGQLHNLKYLRIEGAIAVTKIGPEFLGCSMGKHRTIEETVAFSRLELLTFTDMPNWEEWSFVEDNDEAATAEPVANEGEANDAAAKPKIEAPVRRLQLLPCLKKLHLRNCPKLRAFLRQLGKVATSLKVLTIGEARCLKVVEDFPFLCDNLSIIGCNSLKRISNLPQLRDLCVARCPNLRCVKEFGSLQQLWLGVAMQDVSSLWVAEL
uniref:NB-ARC domain-containing protein n=1 Tax=Oryza glumipatula TaxID=40148 RepID=A0A0E0BLD3_9ORYZ